jgi:hypothetical protein
MLPVLFYYKPEMRMEDFLMNGLPEKKIDLIN